MPIRQPKTPEDPVYRSGAAARLTGIPVQTLRVWERRYNVVGPRQSATGQRLYAPAEVARLALIKRLVDSGHAIGSIAALGFEQLQAMLDKVSSAAAIAPRQAGRAVMNARSPVRIAIIGEALGLRVRHRPVPALQVVGTSPNAALAAETLRGVAADALVIEMPTLQREAPRTVHSLAQQTGARHIVVEYGFGAQRVEQELRALGCSLVHAPLDVDQLASLCGAPPAGFAAGDAGELMPIDPVAPRRFDNKALALISTTAVKMSCECPHHLCELLVGLGNFETYSAECESTSPADAALHQYLKRIAGTARATLEEALVRVAEAEGLPLPT